MESKFIKNQIDNNSDLDNFEQIKLTPLGKYHLFSLVRQFQYIDSIIIDTPILDEDTRKSILLEDEMESRLNRTKNFINYLNSCKTSIKDIEIQRLWEEIYNSIVEDIERIKTKIKMK